MGQHRNARGSFTRAKFCRNPSHPGHLGFAKLEKRIEASERKAHPGYGKQRIRKIAKAAAGKVARIRRAAGKSR